MKYGPFETISELHRGARASVHIGRREGSSDDRFAIKVVEPNVSIIGRAAARQRCDSFLESVTVQEVAAAGSSRHWVNVHDKGIVEEDGECAAYAAMDRYHTSAEALIRFRREVDANQLYSIIRGAIAGLMELNSKYKGPRDRKLDVAEAGSVGGDGETGGSPNAGRCHGNLKPANVLLGEDASKVALADPASDQQVAQDGLSLEDDLNALGRLIYSLLTHREWRGGLGAKVEFDHAWKKLGRVGEDWHRLCRSLLEAGAASGDEAGEPWTLERLTAAVEAMKPIPQTSVRKPILATAVTAAVVILAATAGVYFIARPKPPEYSQTAIAQSPERNPDPISPPRQTPVTAPEPERESSAVESPAQETPLELPAVAEPLPLPASSRVIQTWLAVLDNGNETIAAIPSLAALAEQPEQVEAEQLRKRVGEVIGAAYTARVRLAAADRSGALDRALPEPQVEVIHALVRGDDTTVLENLRRAAEVIEFEAQVGDAWEAYQANAARITATDDDFLTQFPSVVDEQLRTVSDLEALADRITACSGLADEISAALDRWESDIDKPLLARRFAEQPGLEQNFRDWVSAVRGADYALLPETHMPRLDDPRTAFDNLQQRLVSACSQPLPDEFEREQGQLLALVSEIEDIPWDGTRDRRDWIVQRHNRLNEQMQAFSQRWESRIEECVNCENWWQEAATNPPVVLAPLIERWHGEMIRIEQVDCPARSAQVERLSQSLRIIEAGLALADSVPDEGRAVFERKQNEFAAQQSPAVEDFQAWQVTAIELASDFDAIAVQLDQLAGYDEVQATYQKWQGDPVLEELQEVVGDTRARVEALRDLPAERDHLAAIASEQSNPPELRVAAWRRLSDIADGSQPLAVAIRQEQEAWKHVHRIVLEHPAADLDDFADQRQSRWHEQALQIANSRDMDVILASRHDYGVSIEQLPAELQFNDLIRRLTSDNRANDADQVFDLADELLGELSSRRQQWSVARDRIERLQSDLERIAALRGAEGLNPNTVGPGTAGWPGDVIQDEFGNQHLLYWPPDDLQHPPLVFLRLETSGDREVFLCTTEVSLRLFQHVLAQSPESKRQWLPRRFQGAHGWQVSNDAIVLRDRWLGSLDAAAGFACVGEIDGERPQWEHPAHQVMLGAALHVAASLGTRLPTIAEWRAAYEQTYPGGNVPGAAANRRGSEWIAVLKAQAQWWNDEADEGAYIRLRRATAIPGPHRPTPDNPFHQVFRTREAAREDAGNAYLFTGAADGRLWFRTVDAVSSNGERRFRDLVGNVAEFVLSEPRFFQPVSHAQLRTAFAESGVTASVIGASALSDPAIDPSQPLAHEVIHGRPDPWSYSYPDVGFRLAFELPAGQELMPRPEAIVQRLRQDPPYILADGS